jgi:guanosine-3',5'-bis(diphosphate) 3'-pyrophosphohydrolase
MNSEAMSDKALAAGSQELPEYVLELTVKLADYLAPEAIAQVVLAYRLGASAHAGQTRKSGEPYITHPVAVACILADMHLDAEALIAALLHDTIEDTPLKRSDIETQFGIEVADLVEGVTKLDKVQFQSRQEANAESFRKMLLAMARDLRVILIKLADRLHNMRTLDSMEISSRRRIAQETLEIYAPIAQRLGMNGLKLELQDLGFQALYPLRHRVIEQSTQQLYGRRRESVAQIEALIAERLAQMGIPCRLESRVKSAYSTYTKMRADQKSFAQLLDVIGFRAIVPEVMQCYMALGAVHTLYKPVDGRFKDFIAIPKANGYQSLHTVLFGPGGTPIEVQIRTEEMNLLAERGVAAHWSYKTGSLPANNAQTRAREWLSSLLAQQSNASSPLEFVENVKIDLFPDDVYLFTPKGDILALPRNATALDFAYAVHTDVGGHAVAARVDKKLVPLRTRLSSGQSVEIITAASAAPSPSWLEFVVSAKARTAIRHFLKRLQHEDAIEFGHRMLDTALNDLTSSLDAIPPEILENYLSENKFRRLEDLLIDIALGNRMPHQVAQTLTQDQHVLEGTHSSRVREKILLSGNERGVITFGACCRPIPGDEIMGFLSSGKGVVVHQTICPNAAEFRKHPERTLEVDWDRQVQGDFKCALKVVVDNRPGVLATVAAAIAEAQSNIENVEYQERDIHTAALLFTIEVRDRQHLADVMRRVRRSRVVYTIARFTS